MKTIYNITKKTKDKLKIGAVTLVIIAFLLSTIVIVNTGEVGIKTRLGKIVNSNMKDGINFKIPFIETIRKVNIKIQKATISNNGASKDLQDVTATIAVNYRVDGQDAKDLYKSVGRNYLEVILKPAISETLKATLSLYTAEELITKRQEVSVVAKEKLQKKLEMHGLIIEDFNMINFNFSEEFNRAIEDKQVAEQQVLKAKQELEKAKVDAEKKITEAKAEAESLRIQRQEITNDLLRLREIEAQLAAIKKWDGKLPNYTGGTIPFINID